ncbi:unnamed protein product [Debaryomyces tyrocola]|nr:unnamed protein product [Debaryomyces tyrocola]
MNGQPIEPKKEICWFLTI